MTNKTIYLSDSSIDAIQNYLNNNCLSLLSLSYELKISYPTLFSLINKKRKARVITVNKIKQYFAKKGIILSDNIASDDDIIDEEIE